jgi:hemerythrin-like domain-containing protein
MRRDPNMATKSRSKKKGPKSGTATRGRKSTPSRSQNGNGKARAKSADTRDAISVLLRDHDRVRELLSQLEETTTDDADSRRSLLQEIEHEIKVHSRLEEKIFYPAFKSAVSEEDDEKLFHEATEEHHVVDMVLPEVKRADPASVEFSGKAKVLKDLIEHHAEEEEQEMFPLARKVMSKDDLVRLGEEIEEMRGRIS